jgi:hypothetical protein
MNGRASTHLAHLVLSISAVIGCHEQRGPDLGAPATPSAPVAPATPSAPIAPRASPAPCVSPPASAAPSAEPPPSARNDAPFATDPENRQRPQIESADLAERARHLLEAISTGDLSRGDDFFFPRAPFLPLKDVRDPGRYFDQLLATYHRDIRDLHASRRDWGAAKFVSFAIGTTPTWVAPGREYNRIGYYRTFGGKLRWQNERSSGTIDVATIISYHGRLFVTHLAPIHK